MGKLMCACFVILVVFSLLSPVFGRHLTHKLSKRSPQLTLTILDDPETTPRSHPPTEEDLEERRQALVKALTPGGDGGEVAGRGQLQSLTDLGVDLVSGLFTNTGEIFAPLKNATEKAREGLPRPGDVINRVIDGGKEYSQQVSGALRTAGSTVLNNLIRVFTTLSSRGAEVFGGVVKLFRSVLDNLTLAIQNFAGAVSRGITTVTRVGTQFAARNVVRARSALSNMRLFQPTRDAIELGSNLAKGLTDDFTQAQPWINEGVKSKIELGTALVPRVRLSTLLSPLGDPEKPTSDSDNTEEGGYNSKRESASSENKSKKTESDILEPLESLKSESKSKQDATTKSTKTDVTTENINVDEDNDIVTKNSKNGSKTTTESDSTSTLGSSESVDDLFGITSKTSKSE